MKNIRITVTPSEASGRRRGWFKLVTSVDLTKKNGYAFNGEFLREGEQDVPLGGIVIEQYPCGSVKNGYNKGICYRVEETGLVKIVTCEDWYKKFLSFRDSVAEALETLTAPNEIQQQLIEEKKQLLQRLAEIEKDLEEINIHE